MQRRELNLLFDWILFDAALAAFSTGLVLFLCFHTGDGAFAASALGQSKLFWLNLHRFSAVVVALGVVTHVGLNWRPFRARHPWIDTHNISSLASFLLVAHHYGHRWRFMFRPARTRGV